MNLSVSRVARMAGVTVRTLHHYDDIGLLRPSGRTTGGYRRYDGRDLERLRLILVYRELGFTLEEIRTILAGLDPSETAQLGEVVRRLPERGTSVLLVDHDMSLVLGICDVVHVLDFGRLLASGTPAEVRADERVVEAYLGTSSHGDAS